MSESTCLFCRFVNSFPQLMYILFQAVHAQQIRLKKKKTPKTLQNCNYSYTLMPEKEIRNSDLVIEPSGHT